MGIQGGEDAKDRYKKEFSEYVDEKIFTLKDIFQTDWETEDLIEDQDKRLICDSIYGSGSYDDIELNGGNVKSNLNYAIVKLLIQKKELAISGITKDNFKRVFEFLSSKLDGKN